MDSQNIALRKILEVQEELIGNLYVAADYVYAQNEELASNLDNSDIEFYALINDLVYANKLLVEKIGILLVAEDEREKLMKSLEKQRLLDVIDGGLKEANFNFLAKFIHGN